MMTYAHVDIATIFLLHSNLLPGFWHVLSAMSSLSRDGEHTNCTLLSPGSTSYVSSDANVHSDTSDDESDTESLDSAPVTSDCRSRRCKFGGYGFADKMHTFLYWCGKCSFMYVVIVGRRVYIPDINTTWLNDTWRIVTRDFFKSILNF